MCRSLALAIGFDWTGFAYKTLLYLIDVELSIFGVIHQLIIRTPYVTRRLALTLQRATKHVLLTQMSVQFNRVKDLLGAERFHKGTLSFNESDARDS